MNNKLAIGVGAVIVVVIAAGLIIWLVGRGGGDSPPGQGETLDPNATPVVGATQTTSKTPTTPSDDSEPKDLAYAKGVPDDGWVKWEDEELQGFENIEVLVAEDQLIVVAASGATRSDVLGAVLDIGASIVGEIPSVGIFQVELPPGSDLANAIETLERNGTVESAFPNIQGETQQAGSQEPNDPWLDYQNRLYLNEIRAQEAWDIHTGSSAVTIAIVDSGVDEIPDLKPKIVSRINIDQGNSSTLPKPADDLGTSLNDTLRKRNRYHGTAVAGVAAAETDNGEGMAGMSWGASLAVVKVWDGDGFGLFNLAAGIDAAIDSGAKVINVSMGVMILSAWWDGMERIIEKAAERDILVVAAGSNNPWTPPVFPATYADSWDNVIAVASTEKGERVNGFGAPITVSGPNTVGSYAPFRPDNRDAWDGTSFATPQVSGLAALIWSLDHEHNSEFTLTPAQVRGIIAETAKNPKNDPYIGAGVIDAAAALERAAEDLMDPQPNPTLSPTAQATPASTPSAQLGPEPGDLLWRLRVGWQGYAGSSVVLDEIIYEASYEDDIGQYHAIDAITGKPLWQFQVEGGPLRPSVSEGFALFSTDAGHLYGLDADTGELLWRNSVSGEIRGTPVVSGDVVYVKAVDKQADGWDYFIYVFERSDGDLRWKANVDHSRPGLFPTDGAVVFLRSRECVEARDAVTGELLWQYCPSGGSVGLDGVWGGEVYGTFENSVFILDAVTGDVRHQVDSPPGLYVYHVAGGVAYGQRGRRLGAMEVSTRAILWNQDFPEVLWPTVHGGIIYFSGGGSINAIDSGTGELLWKFTYGGSEEDPRPVISDNVVYIEVDDQLLALDPSTGQLLWKSNPSVDFVDSIAVSDDVVYMRTRNYLYAYADSRKPPNIAPLSDNPVGELLWRQADEGHIGSPVLSNDAVVARSENGVLSSFDQQTGDLQWTSRIGGPHPPVVSGDRVYTGSGEGRVYALNASNGEPVWSYEADGRYAFVTSPAVGDGVLYFGARTFDSYRFDLLAVNELSTGPQKWSYEIDWGLDFLPQADGGVVYFVESERLKALDASTAELLWETGTHYTKQVHNPPAISGNIVYATSGGDGIYRLDAYQARSGEKLWNYVAGGEVFTPVADEDVVYFGAADDHFYAVDDTGEILWKFDAGDWVVSRPAVSEGVVYFGSSNALLFALDATSGEVLWTYKLKDSVRTSPAASDGVVYIGTRNYLYALRGPRD